MKTNLLLIFCLLGVFHLAHAQKLYIAENGAQQIQRSNLNGTGLELISGSILVNSIRDIVIDELENEVYWIENDASFARVKRAEMRPTAPGIGIELNNVVDFIRVASGVPVPANQFEGLAIDPVNRNLYITNQSRIERVSLDEVTPVTVLPPPIATGLFQTFGIDVDRVNDLVYFVNQATSRQIQRINLDGSGITIIVNDFAQGTIHDVVVEPLGGNLYFTTVNLSGVGEVRKTDLFGTSPLPIVTSLPTSIRGLAVDGQGGNIYWATGGANIGRASLTGAGATNIVTGLNNAFYVTLDLRDPLADKMYWTEEVGNYINRANRDGSDVEEYYTGVSIFPQGVAYDYVNNYIYWTDTDGNVKRGQIGETDFVAWDVLIDESLFPSSRPNMGISLDIAGGKMYWASNWDGSIKVADFNDPSPISTMQQIVTGLSNPRSVAVDPSAGKIYYTENKDAGDNIAELHQANLDGSGDVVLFSFQIPTIDFLFNDVKLDLSNNTIYWSGGQDDDSDTENFGEIFMADLSDVPGTVTSFDTNTAGEAWGIDLDVANGHIYWVNRGFMFPDPPINLPQSIMRADLNGSNMEELVDNNFLTSPYFIALNVVPAPPPACSAAPSSDAGIDQFTCGTNPVLLAGSISNAASASWSTTGDGAFANANNLSTSYVAGPNDISNGSVLLTLTTEDPDGTGPCVEAASSVTITISAPASLDAGVDFSICPGDAVSLSATLGGSGSNPLWTTNGDGTFSDNTSLTAIYVPGPTDIGTGTVTLSLTAGAAGSCPFVSDQLDVVIAQNPVAAPLSISASVGQSTNTNVIAAASTGPGDAITVTIISNGTKGNASVQPNNTINYTPNAGTVGADSYQYRICNQCNLCSDADVTINILNEPPAIATPGSINAVAGQSVVILFASLLSDINNNLDPASITILSGPTSNALATFDAAFNLTLDYSNTPFAGTDQLTIEVCDLLGACSQITLNIFVDGEITVFNGVSTNGDLLNPILKLENIQFLEPTNKVTIYNRWGDKVFEIDNYDNAQRSFTGISDDGGDLPSGVYFYRVEFASGRKELEGFLTIKR